MNALCTLNRADAAVVAGVVEVIDGFASSFLWEGVFGKEWKTVRVSMYVPRHWFLRRGTTSVAKVPFPFLFFYYYYLQAPRGMDCTLF